MLQPRNMTKIAVLRSLVVYMLCAFMLLLYSRISFSGALSYCNPLVIGQAVLIFRVFQSMRINNNWINSIAGYSFGVYLLHTWFFRYARIEYFVTGNLVLIPIHVLLSSILIYAICAVIYWGYTNTLRRILSSWLNKLNFISYQIE